MKKQSGKIKNPKKKKNNTPTKQKTPPKQNTRRKTKPNRTWNGCGAENRGLKGEGLWLPQGDAPLPPAEHRVWPSHPAPKSLGRGLKVATEVSFAGRKKLQSKPTQAPWSPSRPTSQGHPAPRSGLNRGPDALSQSQAASGRPQNLSKPLQAEVGELM